MTELNRLPENGVTDRAALDALLDSQWAGVLSTSPTAGRSPYRCSTRATATGSCCTARPARARCAGSRPGRRRC